MTNPNNPQDPNTIDENVETFDAAVLDTDNDGTIDTALVDLDGDGTIDTVVLDSENADGVLETEISAEDDYVEGLGNIDDYTEKAEEPADDLFDFQGTTTEIGTDNETYDASATEDTMTDDTFSEDMGDSDGPTLHLDAGF